MTMHYDDLIGQTLDEKYRIEKELGKGGMGTVYLATHLGTERPVAVKVIAPQFMRRPEFVERFRREARAAGRLRHPNVVDVTDFGFAFTRNGQVAYLAMEYLDGCTLGEILEEEKNLPVGWTLDILEQVSSAIQEAHHQNIIHRDLKPDNIWLEPNQRGGYTVKVLDFGIAKLEADMADQEDGTGEPVEDNDSGAEKALPTIHDSISPTLIYEGSGSNTVAQNDSSESRTAILAPLEDTDAAGTKLLSESDGNIPYTIKSSNTGVSTGDLTRVGAVLGTPLYMSPEQCEGKKLDARSDIYSLGVIAYQMLSGATPFNGEFTQILEAHRSTAAPPLKGKKLRKKLRKTIHQALEKDPAKRPQSVEAFATILRSRSEGIFGLLRRAGMIYTEHLSKFVVLSTLSYFPMMIFTAFVLAISVFRAIGQLSDRAGQVLTALGVVSVALTAALGAYLIIGTTTWIVAQSIVVPLRPIRLRLALKEAARKWKQFAGTGLISTVGQAILAFGMCIGVFILVFVLLGIILGFGSTAALSAFVAASVAGMLTFFGVNVCWALIGPVVMMENLRGLAAIKRSTHLVRRSLVTSIAAVVIMFAIPTLVAGTISAVINLSVRGIAAEYDQAGDLITFSDDDRKDRANDDGGGLKINIGTSGPGLVNMSPDMEKRLGDAIRDTLLQVILVPVQILMTSFTAIIVALLYLKTRQAGGETTQVLLERFDENEQSQKKWQQRVRRRLIESGKLTSRPTG